MQGVQQGPQQEPQPQGAAAEGSASETDERNNAPATQNTSTGMLLDVGELRHMPSSPPPPRTEGPTLADLKPYRSVVRSHQVLAKVDAPCPNDRDELDLMAEMYRRKMCRLVARVTNQQCIASTSYVGRGCILFLVVVHTRYELCRSLSPEDVLDCLPSHLQRRRIAVVTDNYCAIMTNLVRLSYRTREQMDRDGMGSVLPPSTTSCSPRTVWIEPPCVSKTTSGSAGQKMEIMMRAPEESNLRCITQIGSHAINDSQVEGDSHEVTIEDVVSDEMGFCGTVHVIREDEGNVPCSGPPALFGVFSEEAAAELNKCFYEEVQRVQEKMHDNLAAREIVWTEVIQPFLTDINLLCNHDPLARCRQQRTKESVDICRLAFKRVLNFLELQKLEYCALLLTQCGTTELSFRPPYSTFRATECCQGSPKTQLSGRVRQDSKQGVHVFDRKAAEDGEGISMPSWGVQWMSAQLLINNGRFSHG